MDEPKNAMNKFNDEHSDFNVVQLLNRMITLFSFHIVIGIVGLFAYYRQHQLYEFFHQILSILSLLVTIYLIDDIINEQIYLQQRFITSLRYTIFGHNHQDGRTSYWLQMIQMLLDCCGSTNRPEKQFHHGNIPLTCCETINATTIRNWNMNRILKCPTIVDRKEVIKLKLKKPCNRSSYYLILTNGFWVWFTMNITVQFIIVNIVFRIYCRRSFLN